MQRQKHEKTEIRDAICAHAEWRGKLSDGIECGHLAQSSAEVMRDDVCAFGRWLEEFSCTADTVNEAAAQKCERIKALHTRFHAEAGKIVAEVERGNRDKAQSLFADEHFNRLTNSLVLTLDDWRKDFTSAA